MGRYGKCNCNNHYYGILNYNYCSNESWKLNNKYSSYKDSCSDSSDSDCNKHCYTDSDSDSDCYDSCGYNKSSYHRGSCYNNNNCYNDNNCYNNNNCNNNNN